jgi:hypothetical protein
MPRGLPRTKRTAKPQRDLFDCIAKLRSDPQYAQVERKDGIVRIYDRNRFFMLTEHAFDEYLEGKDKQVRININVSEGRIDWNAPEDPLRGY